MQHAINKNTPRGNRISATNVHLKLMIATLSYQTSTNSFVRDSNYRGKRLKIFKRNRPDHLSDMGSMVLYRLPPHWYCWLLLCTDAVAGWIIGAGGGIGWYGRNVNQTPQRGTQSAYTGSEAMVGGAQVLLPVMSLNVSKGHSLKGSKFPLVEKEVSTGGKFIFHGRKDIFPLVENRRVPNSRLTHNKKNKQKRLLIVQRSH